MKKTVLFLMNGFGIEQTDSYNVYNSKLMPNLDSYTQKYMFSSIEDNSYNYMDGYRLFSTGSTIPLTYQLLKNYMENFEKNPNMNFYLNSINSETKVQLFIFIENDKSLEHLKNLLKFIRTKHNNTIFLHIVLTSPDLNNYKELEHIITKINYDYKECKIGTIIGKNVLCGNDLSMYMNLLKNEVGEKWREISRKFSALTTSKNSPIDVKEFYMNEGFKISENDVYFFFNYDYLDLTNLLNNITSLAPNSKFFSMFQIKGIKYPMFAYPISGKSMVNSLKSIEAKGLILTENSYVNQINYMANGLNNVVADNLFFVPTNEALLLDKNKLNVILNDSKYDLTIIDYRIDNVETLEQLNDKLAKLDVILGYVHDICIEKGISLFISSLYGIKKNITVDNFTKAFINFSGKLPLIVIDPVFNKVNFRLGFGNTFNLAHTVYTNINKKYKDGEVLIKKKSILSKMIKK